MGTVMIIIGAATVSIKFMQIVERIGGNGQKKSAYDGQGRKRSGTR